MLSGLFEEEARDVRPAQEAICINLTFRRVTCLGDSVRDSWIDGNS